MKSTVPQRTSVWTRQHTTVSEQVFAFILAVALEFTRAIAAASRYEQLRLKRRACDDPEADPARRIYLEFYSDR
jgi:hypothetical protein